MYTSSNFKVLDYLACCFIVTFPLGIWKLVEIIVWLFKHVKISL